MPKPDRPRPTALEQPVPHSEGRSILVGDAGRKGLRRKAARSRVDATSTQDKRPQLGMVRGCVADIGRLSSGPAAVGHDDPIAPAHSIKAMWRWRSGWSPISATVTRFSSGRAMAADQPQSRPAEISRSTDVRRVITGVHETQSGLADPKPRSHRRRRRNSWWLPSPARRRASPAGRIVRASGGSPRNACRSVRLRSEPPNPGGRIWGLA